MNTRGQTTKGKPNDRVNKNLKTAIVQARNKRTVNSEALTEETSDVSPVKRIKSSDTSKNDLDVMKILDKANPNEYKTEKIDDLCHFQESALISDMNGYLNPNPTVLDDYIINLLLEESPESEIALHRKGRQRTIVPYKPDLTSNPSSYVPLTKRRYPEIYEPCKKGLSRFDPEIHHYALSLCEKKIRIKLLHLENELEATCEQFYFTSVVIDAKRSAELCATSVLSSLGEWREERLIRIPARAAHSIFTYCKNKDPDWEKKVEQLSGGCFKSSISTTYGRGMKTAARKELEKCGYEIERVGFFVHPSIPWLGTHPDGVVGRKYLLEILCPAIGNKLSVSEAVATLNCVVGDANDGSLKLKKTHTFYTQINIGMGLMHLEACYLMIFCSLDSSFVVLEVPFDKSFFDHCVRALEKAYFLSMLNIIRREFSDSKKMENKTDSD